MVRKEKKWMEKSKRPGTALTTRWHICVQCGMNANLSLVGPWATAVCDHLNKEKQSRDADTNNKEERLQKQTSSAVVQSTASTSHWSYSWVSTCFMSFHMLLGLSLCVPRSLVVNAPNLFTFWPVREFLVEIHTAKTGLLRCCLDTPRRLQQTAVSYKRSNCSSIETKKTNSWKSFVWGFNQRRNTTGFSVQPCRFACILIYRLSLNYYELHQESLHCHQLEEELDDWCHCRYFQNGMGLSCRSPDSWCKRFNVDNASLKSERFLHGPVSPDLLREIHHFCLYRKYSDSVM